MAKSIVIVDDEKLVVYGLCSLLSDADSGFTVAATGSCGEEGLKLCIEKMPDLLLTDIGMPGMDGLQLIERVRKTNPDMKVVALSCHDEYSLVHKAFMLGADDYILKKDIDKLNLYNLLNRILPERQKVENIETTKHTIRSLSEVMDFIPETPGSIGIIGFKSRKQHNNPELMWQPDIPMLQQLINEEIAPHGEYYLGIKNDLVIYLPGFSYKERDWLDRQLKKARQSASKYINHKVFIARYIMKPSERLAEAYNQGQEILKGMFYKSNGVILTEKTSPSCSDSNLSFNLTSGNFDNSWNEILTEYLSSAQEKQVDPDIVKSDLNFAVKHLLHHLKENAEPELVSLLTEIAAHFHREILNFNDIELLKKWSINLLSRITEELKIRQSTNRAVYSAKLYINTNLDKDLRLSTVAEILSVNSNHLSGIFRKTTGQTYIEYVNTKRVNHACELIETTDLSAKEIAFNCGYDNPNYFSRIFKKITGTTVSEYKNSKNRKL